MAHYKGSEMHRSLLRLTLCAFFSFGLLSESSALELEVATFNVKWFGVRVDDPRGGKPSPIDPAKIKQRAQIMRDFMNTILAPKDVVAFQEVVDVAMLKQTLPAGWNCISYQHRNPHHQKVAICASPKFKFMPVPYDRDPTIEEIAIDPEWGRPGVRADLADASGKRLLRIVALHLKSAPEFTKDRVYQMQVAAKDLGRDRPVPTLVLGDMNTFWPKDTNQRYPDVNYLENELRKFDQSFRHIPHTEEFTFRSHKFYSQFDHIFINGQVKLVSGPSVFRVCNQKRDGTGYYKFDFYYENVSDHCPVKARIAL